MIFDKDAKTFSVERAVVSANGSEKAGYPHAK